MGTEDGALPAREFMRELFAWRQEVLPTSTYREALDTGRATPAGLRAMAGEVYFAAVWFPRQISAILSWPLDEETFMAMSKNYAREAGWYETPYHARLLYPFGAALGWTPADFDAYEPTSASLAYMYTGMHFCRSSAEEGLTAVAMVSEGVGSKLVTADSASPLRPTADILIERYGFSEEQVVFWRTHQHVQDDDVGSGLAVVERHVQTATQQQRVRHAFRTCVRLLAERDAAYAAVLTM
jgi:pyrroloquinoline quinone (PQQ) biosynthesis protein C